MFPHPVVSFSTYLEVHSSILRKNMTIGYFFAKLLSFLFSRSFCLGSLAGVICILFESVTSFLLINGFFIIGSQNRDLGAIPPGK